MILVVASHQETREALTPLVASRGYPVAAIECGDELLKRLRFQKPSLVVIDCGLAGSFEMLDSIRAERTASTTPVVMFSIDDENVREKALLRGADAYVPKGSLDWIELMTEIDRFVGTPASEQSQQRLK